MPTVTTKDGVEIFYKDWGSGQPIVFSHGWPLSADDWDAQMLFFLSKGYRVIAHDRRGHGRSTQVADGHDMDHYADDLAAVTAHLDLKDAIHVGHSTGGGEVVRYLAPPWRQPRSEGGDHQRGAAADAEDRGQSPGIAEGSVRRSPGAARRQSQQVLLRSAGRTVLWLQPSGRRNHRAVVWNWWRQGMMGGAKAHYDGIVAFSQTDFTEDLKKIKVPVLVMHSEDDQIVPYVASGPLSAKLLKNGTLKTYKDFPHGMITTQADVDQRRPACVLAGLAPRRRVDFVVPVPIHRSPSATVRAASPILAQREERPTH